MKPTGHHFVAEFIYCSRGILNSRKGLQTALRHAFAQTGIDLIGIESHKFNPYGVTIIAVVGESHVAIHTYPEARHASVDVFTCSADRSKPVALLHYLRARLMPRTVRIVELQRGNPIEIKEMDWITSFTASGFEIKYHIKKKLLSKRSRYQQIDIINNDNFGRILFLDRDIQISEYDAHIYDDCMVSSIIKTKRKLNKVAILGGGDGGVLREILKYKPMQAFLVDIDGDVVAASRKYLRKICGSAFSRKNANIVIDDANNFLTKAHGFDAVIYDLTMHPEALTKVHRIEFLSEMFAKMKNSLRTTGMVSFQCCSEFDKETQKLLRRLLPKYFKNIRYSTTFIPSFCENWIFASAKKK